MTMMTRMSIMFLLVNKPWFLAINRCFSGVQSFLGPTSVMEQDMFSEQAKHFNTYENCSQAVNANLAQMVNKFFSRRGIF